MVTPQRASREPRAQREGVRHELRHRAGRETGCPGVRVRPCMTSAPTPRPAAACTPVRRRTPMTLAALCIAAGCVACGGGAAARSPAGAPRYTASVVQDATFPDSAWPVVRDLAAAGYDP